MPTKVSCVIFVVTLAIGLLFAFMGSNKTDLEGNTTEVGKNVAIGGWIVIGVAVIFLFAPNIGSWINSKL